MSVISGGGGAGGGGDAQQQFVLVQNNNIIERVVQSSIGGKGQSFSYRPQQQHEYGIEQEHLQEDSDGGGSTSSGAGGDRGYGEEMLQQGGKSGSSGGGNGQQKRGGMVMDDKKMRRQIANSNERRRMQSINAGFQSLRNLLPHHEGEKLSKAAILQQTAEYIYNLEQEKTQLLQQCCYYKRLLSQHDGAQDLQQTEILPAISASPKGAGSSGTTVTAVALVPSSTTIIPNIASPATTTTTGTGNGGHNKKRKMVAAVSDSSDEGLGSMSPEPHTIILSGKASTTTTTTTTTKKQQAAALAAAELKAQQQQQAFECHDVYTVSSGGVITEVVEPCVDIEIDMDSASLEEVSSERSVPTSAAPLPKKKRITVESVDSELEGATGLHMVNGQITKIFRDLNEMHNSPQEMQELQVLTYDNDLVLCSAFPGDAAIAYETVNVEMKPSPPQLAVLGKLGKAKVAAIDVVKESSADKKSSKLQPLLESFDKKENKVEVERISGSPVTIKEEPGTAGARAFLGASTSRQNLETIVEAIRHLEGDRFGEQPKNRNGVVLKTEGGLAVTAALNALPVKIVAAVASGVELPTQEVPLALTTKSSATTAAAAQRQQAELSQFVQFRTGTTTTGLSVVGGSSSSRVGGGAGAVTTGSSSAGNSSSNNSSSAMPKLATTTTTGNVSVSVNGQPATIVLHQLQQQQRPGVIVAKQSS